MKNAWIWIILAAAMGAVAWFFLGDSLGLGSDTSTEVEISESGELIEGDDSVTLAATGTGGTKTAGTNEVLTAATSDPLALGGFVVRGRVVNETRHPMSANVAVWFPGQEPVRAATGADGRFEVALGEQPTKGRQVRGTVLARAPGDLIAMHLFWVWGANTDETDTGAIVLRKGQPLTVRVTHGGAPVAEARVALLGSGMWGNRSLFLEATANESGELVVPLMPSGPMTALAMGPAGTGRGKVTDTLPRPDPSKPIEVELSDERILDVEVVDKETGAPVVGAQILVGGGNVQPPPAGDGYLPDLTIAPTDEQGRTQIHGLASNDKDRLRLVIVAEGYPRSGTSFGPGSRINEKRVRNSETQTRIELVRLRTVTFPIKPGDVDPPPEGATLKVMVQGGFGPMPSGDDGASASIRDGDLVIEGLKPHSSMGMVVSEQGTIASFRAAANASEGKAVTFLRGRRLHVRARTASGNPAVGVHIALQGRSNFKLVGPEKTDENGEVILPATDLTAGDVKVMSNPSQWWSATVVDSVDLTKQEGILDVTLPDDSRITLAIRVDGQIRLPTTYWLRVGGRYVAPGKLEERPDTGELILSTRLPDGDKPVSVGLNAEGFLGVNKAVARDELGKPVQIELEPSATIIVRYTKPEAGRFSLVAQRWNDEKDAWHRASTHNNFTRPGAQKEEDTQRFEGMQAGRYRILESRSMLTSDTFDLVLRAPPAEIFMDMSVLTYTEGRVQVPDGYNVRQARIQRAGAGGSSTRSRRGGSGVKQDGTFRLRSMRGEPLELTVSHPLLVPAKAGGVVKTKGGARDALLKLEAGAELRFKVAGLDLKGRSGAASERAALERVLVESAEAGAPMPMMASSGRVPVSFRAYRGGTIDGEAVRTGSPIAEDGTLRIGGLEPGVYSFFFERSDHAPRTMRNVELAKGTKDIGVIDFNKGSTVTVTLKTVAGKPVPNVWAQARALDGPSYSRSARNNGKGELKFEGLGAGRFKLTITAQSNPFGGGSNATLFDDEIVVDGSNDMSAIVEVKN